MNKYELSTHPDVGSLADRQASLHLNDQELLPPCRVLTGRILLG